MKYLNFTVNQMMLEKTGDFENLIAKSSGYLYAHFSFSPDWGNLQKVAVFRNAANDVIRYEPIIDNVCPIPDVIAQYNHVIINVIGQLNDTKIETNTVTFSQKGGIG